MATTNGHNSNGHSEPLLVKSDEMSYGGACTKPSSQNEANDLIETQDVSFSVMVYWLLWKNMKSQCLRRKKSWCVKMLIPVVFTLVLAALRTAFTTDNEPVDYGDFANNAASINQLTTSNQYWAPLTLCDNTTDNPAFLISIVPPYGTNEYIDSVIDKLNESWIQTSPPNIANDRCMDYASNLPFAEGWLIKYFDTDNDVDSYCRDSEYGKGYNITANIDDNIQRTRPIGFGITFDIPTADGKDWSYRLRFNASGGASGVQPGQGPPQLGASSQFPVPSTSQSNVNNFNRALTDQWLQGSSNYAYSSFINLQAFVDNAITKAIAELDDSNPYNDEISNYVKGYFVFPTPAYETDDFWVTLEGLFVFFILISFVYPFSQIVKALVEEKADKIKEGLKMMGATFTTFWVSWYIWFFFEFVIMAFCFTFIGKWLDVFLYSDVTVIFVWMLLFCINLVTYATLVSTIFDNPKVASLIATFIFIIALYGGFFGLIMNGSQKNALCLLGPSCYSVSLTNLAQYESSLIGLQWSNINDEYQEFAFSTAIWMLLFDSILYIALTLYLDRVFPSRYGQRESPFFICLPRFWCPKKHTMESENKLKRGFTLEETDCFEDLGNKYGNVSPAISLRRLTKHFTSLTDKRVVKAVNGISMDIYSGEVFCLLGHNGAGKTTTISMLTGLLEITSGNAWILGNSVSSGGMKNIRKSLGVCPQHDTLFKRLTVREHLELFCRLKGVPSALIEQEVNKTIESIGVQDKENEFPPNLSGGMKRKLSLGIALIGGSKVVFLDEPTSGMDPQSRRVTWDLIAREKKNRCIILTTHFMDEADILADRIAIMSTGYVRCCGSSLFLKRLYGVGYTFVLSLNIGCDPAESKARIDEIVLNKISGSSLITVAGGEISYRLPFEETASFPDVFEELDTIKEEVGISTYGISITTLEEVFLKIGEEHRSEIEGADEDDSDSSASDPFDGDNESIKLDKTPNGNGQYTEIEIDDDENGNNDNVSKPTPRDLEQIKIQKSLERHKSDYDGIDEVFPMPNFQLEEQSEIMIFLEHFFAILYRRWFWGIRDARALCCQVMLPGWFAAVGLIILKLTQTVNNPNLVLDTNQFYGSNPGLNGYMVPYTNISSFSNTPNKPFSIDSDWTQTYNTYLSNSSGTFDYISFGDATNISFDVKPFQDWLLDNYDVNDKYHYNAFWTANELNEFGISFNSTIQLGINATAVHALPIVYNLANNWILKQEINPTANIKISSFPLVVTSNEKAISDSLGGIFASIYLMIAFAFIPVGAVYNIVMDRTKLTKHQQLVSGISFISYWVGNFIADFIAAIPAMIIVYILVHAFSVDVYLGEAQLPFILVLVIFTFSILPFTYILSYLFSAPDKAQTVVGTIYLILGMILLIVSFVLDNINDNTKRINDIFENVYRIFPTFLMADGLFQVGSKGLLNPNKSYYDWDVCGRNLTLMSIECVGYFCVVLLIEYVLASPNILSALGFVTDCADDFDEELDDDVAKEMERIKQQRRFHQGTDSMSSVNGGGNDQYTSKLSKDSANSAYGDDTVVLAGLRKVYKGSNGQPPNVAVRNVYLGVPQGQVFGYLGVNGAGKTTTLACLTGERYKSSGNAYIHGIPIENQMACRRFIGYCPQFDALFDLLTGKEHLQFYGMLKGLRGQKLKDQVSLLLKVLSLTKYKNRKAGTYSGGNKRKLSVAIAMIGNPPVVFLDEPSTGMDPMARRHMWEFIRETMSGRCVLLTTHSMEECEALCHKLGIMVKGQLRCLGTPQHLKSKFGNGYQLDMTLEDDDEKTYLNVEQELNTIFDLRLIERNQTKITYELLQNDEMNDDKPTTLAQMFRTLESFKQNESNKIVAYALNQTTLEQIFIRMAKKHDAISEF